MSGKGTRVAEFFGVLAGQPELVLFALVGFGALVGHVSVRGVALGAAAVLFVGIALSALASANGVTLVVHEIVGHVGLALFTFCVGMSSGPTFFHTLRTAGPALVGVIVAIVAGGVVALLGAPLAGLSTQQAAGVFAGAVTNTPALAAAGNTPEATVGYSVAYLFGVAGMLVITQLALSHAREDADLPAPLVTHEVRIEQVAPGTTIADLQGLHGNHVSITRVWHEDAAAEVARDDHPLAVGEVITVVGTEQEVDAVVRDLGHVSSHHLRQDRATLDFRRVTVSDPKLAGRPIRSLELPATYGATIARVRRGDVDMLGHPDLVLQLGDRVRVVAPRVGMEKVTAFFGDSSRGLTAINPAAFGLGMALGFALGAIGLPLPGGGTFTLGPALGCLLVGLTMGRVARVGSVVLSLPFTVTAVIAELGLLLFLAQAGTRAGGMILQAFASGSWLAMLLLGAAITLTVGLASYGYARLVLKVGGTRLAGMLAGIQTQPALLAFANQRTEHDFRVAAGYTMVYPVAMLTKILTASVLRLLG